MHRAGLAHTVPHENPSLPKARRLLASAAIHPRNLNSMQKRFLAAAILLPLSATAAAQNATGAPSYTYVQGTYTAYGHAHGVGKDYNGYGIKGSFAINPHVFVNASYDWLDVNDRNLDANRTSVGVGLDDFFDYGGAPGTGLGYYGQVSYERLGLQDVRCHDDASGNGFGVDAGLRWMVEPRIEINPHVGYVDYGNVDGDTNLGDANGVRYGVRVRGYVTPAIALSVGYRGSNASTDRRNIGFDNEVRVGASWNF
ncbi:outer membrane beta-barrel protein [Salinisphaera hydrothermalis]|nr:outer membrane beta-barrel protein [Salinisphaera hydrothermalis]